MYLCVEIVLDNLVYTLHIFGILNEQKTQEKPLVDHPSPTCRRDVYVQGKEVQASYCSHLNWLNCATLVQAKTVLSKTYSTVVLLCSRSRTGSRLYTRCKQKLEQQIVHHMVVIGKVYMVAAPQGTLYRGNTALTLAPCVLSRSVPPIGMVSGMNATGI